MCVTIPHGIIWMVSGGIVSSMTSLIINTYYTGKLINVGYLKQMGDLLPIFGVSFAMWLIIHVSFIISQNIYIQLIVGITIGILTYFIGSLMFLKPELNDVIGMLPNKLKIYQKKQ